MSNHLAVATVSAALRDLVDEAASAALTGVLTNVETGRPDRLVPAEDEAAVSIFLYQVTQNPHWRSDDLPTRRSDGSLVEAPQAALDLYYLLTFFGVEGQQHPELLLGGVATALHAEPVLSRARVESVVTSEAHLAASDLASQPELVRFAPVELNLEELSKLWSVFFQTNYRLSVAYKGSVVLLSPDDAVPQPTYPVAVRNLYVETLTPPQIESVGVAGDATAPIVIGDELIIRGRNLRGDDTRVTLGEHEAVPGFVSASEVRVNLTEGPFAVGALRAGPVAVRIVHSRMMGTPETAHAGPKSNLCAAIVHPRITGLPLPPTAANSNYALTVEPTVGTRQRVFLQLTGTPGRYAIPAAPRTADTDTLAFDISRVATGTYLIRVEIDGSESLLERTDTDSDLVPDLYTAPTLEVVP